MIPSWYYLIMVGGCVNILVVALFEQASIRGTGYIERHDGNDEEETSRSRPGPPVCVLSCGSGLYWSGI